MSEDSDPGLPKTKTKRKKCELSSSSDSDTSGSSPVARRRPARYKNNIRESESDSSIEKPRKKQRIYRVTETESSDSESDGSEIIINKKKTGRVVSDDSQSDRSDNGFDENSSWESESDSENENNHKLANVEDNFSDSSDGNSEKCPICLLRFKNQEIGTPETCDHSFCVDCIQAWSQNVNTCPVDRQQFTLILVRKCLNGRIIRQISVDVRPQNEENVAPEDPTYCEICGQCDREDRLLLCDGCDLGYHLECLDPPLEFVPLEEWFCSECVQNELVLLQNNQSSPQPSRHRQRHTSESSPRLVPRTLQTERVRAQIATNRRQISSNQNQSPISSGFESFGAPGPSYTRNRSATTKPKRSYKKRRSTKRKSSTYYFDIDENTGEKIKVYRYKKTKRRKRKIKKRKQRKVIKPKTVKKRLAAQLGMCAPKKVGLNIPEVKIRSSSTIGLQRSQAGIPTLHLFGQRDQLDYFSNDEEEVIGGNMALLTRSRPISEALAARRAARRKIGVISTPPTVNSCDLLGSILNDQEKFHSKSSVLSVNSDGTLNIENKNNNNNNNEAVDLKSVETLIVQAPMFPGNRGGNRPYFNRGGNNYHGNSNYEERNSYYQSYNSRGGPSRPYFNQREHNSNVNYQNYSQNTPPFRGRGPIRFPMRRPQIPREEQEPMEFLEENSIQNQNMENQENEDVDIYSDIEDGGPTQDEIPIKSPPRNIEPAPIPDFQTDNQNNSESENEELIIDDTVKESEKYDPEDPSHDTDSNESPQIGPKIPTTTTIPEESDTSNIPQIRLNVTRVPIVSKELLKEAVKEVLHEHLDKKKLNTQNEDASDDDDCPNFSIYSAESIDIAKSADSDIPKFISQTPDEDLPTQNDDHQNEPEDQEENCVEPSLEVHENENENKTDEGEVKLIQSDKEVDQINDKEDIEEGEEDSKEKTDEHQVESGEKQSVVAEVKKSPIKVAFDPTRKTKPEVQKQVLSLYDDSDLEEWDGKTAKNVSKDQEVETELEKMTEAISEEERSYTPCLDEKEPSRNSFSEHIGGLDTEMISDDEKNDFDESHDLKTISESDALEINAKESELDIVRPEDYEEGEIIEKKGTKKSESEPIVPPEEGSHTPQPKKKEAQPDKEGNLKEKNRDADKSKKTLEFKKLSKNTKERNYRDKENKKSPEKGKEGKENKKQNRKERKQDLERYCVRSLMADKPRKDQFGRDLEVRGRSGSRDNRSFSFSPRRSTSRRRSISYDRKNRKERKRRSHSRKSRSRSYSPRRSRSRRSRSPRRSKSPRKKSRNYRSPSRDRYKNRKSLDRSNKKTKKQRNSRSPSYNKHRYERRQSFNREWTPSWSRTPSPRPVRHNMPQSVSPSWTPPLEKRPQTENLTVILKNTDNTKKKKDKKKKIDKKNREELRKRKRTERTPPPSKEVFASGDNILVSVSFNKPDETTREVVGVKRKRDLIDKKSKKDKTRDKRKRAVSPKLKKKKNKTTLNIKPVAIIDLDRSPFKEITPSPKDVIVLSDSDHAEKNDQVPNQNTLLEDKEIQNSAPESPNYLNTGPKTPPEPQIKFLLSTKQTQLRAISNPLHDPLEQENEDPQEELDNRNESHKGPNTPPEPPNSPPSSPDAYDPFEPTKSRSPTPEPEQNQTEKPSEADASNISGVENSADHSDIDKTTPNIDNADNEKQETEKNSPTERIGVVINQQVQQANVFPVVKPIISTAVFSSGSQSIITSTPTLSTSNLPRANLFNTSTLSNASRIQTSVPQRIILPTTSKSSPAKMSPAKLPIKSTPIKPMQSSKTLISKLPVPNVKPITPIRKTSQVQKSSNQNGNDVIEVASDFESPYSPGSSDYEDLFEPPAEMPGKNNSGRSAKNTTKSPAKNSSFDTLFAASPVFRNKSNKKSSGSKSKKSKTPQKHNKTHVGVKLDEDNLKILDELPNSAVEMQVKDKFLKKLNRQERVVEEVKHVLKPHYNKKHITKEQYKDILRRAVPKICHNKSGEINPKKIQNLIEAYVKRARHSKKAAANPGQPNQQAAQQTKPAKTTFWS